MCLLFNNSDHFNWHLLSINRRGKAYFPTMRNTNNTCTPFCLANTSAKNQVKHEPSITKDTMTLIRRQIYIK